MAAIIKITIKPRDEKRGVREIQEIRVIERKFAATRPTTAADFLVSTGMYNANGRLKPQYR